MLFLSPPSSLKCASPILSVPIQPQALASALDPSSCSYEFIWRSHDAATYLSHGELPHSFTVCGGGSSYTAGPWPTSTPTEEDATSVYVIQHPSTFGVSSRITFQFSATATGSASPVTTITASTGAFFNGLATDGKRNFYVSTRAGLSEDIRVYAAGATTPPRILPGTTTTKIGAVDGIAARACGEILVGQNSGGIAAFGATGLVFGTSAKCDQVFSRSIRQHRTVSSFTSIVWAKF